MTITVNCTKKKLFGEGTCRSPLTKLVFKTTGKTLITIAGFQELNNPTSKGNGYF